VELIRFPLYGMIEPLSAAIGATVLFLTRGAE
jgi:hypothetical protein